MSKKTPLYLVGNSHIDPVWLWQWQEGYNEVLCTFRSALDRMKDFPDFKFVSACALYYEWVERMDPAMFEEIRQRIKEGRWNVVGGWLIQPDCNLPSGESFARHGLISQRYFREKLGTQARTGYNVDSFGHNASIPMILNQSGMDRYVFMRPNPTENANLHPLFRWESSDGSAVTAYRLHRTYGVNAVNIELLDQLRAFCDEDGLPRMALCGVGNHGGGPTLRFLKQVKEKNLHHTGFSTVDEYFDSVSRRQLPTVRDELQHHAVGCYSACHAIKKSVRRCEENLLLAEKLSVLAKRLTGWRYPHEELTRAWKKLLFNQFHDILGGCSIESAYTDAAWGLGEVMSITEDVIHEAIQKICGDIDTLRSYTIPAYKTNDKTSSNWMIWSHDCLGTPVAVFNPHTWSVRTAVYLTGVFHRVTDEAGNDVPFQIVRGEQTNHYGRIYATVFLAELEPFGYRVYRAFTEAEPEQTIKNDLRVTEHTLENSLVRVEFDPNSGEISSFYDKKAEKRIIDRPCSTVLLDETACDTWAHNQSQLGPVAAISGTPVFTVKESGPVRATLKICVPCGESIVSRSYTLLAGSDRLRVDTEIDFREKHRTLKLTFPLDATESVTAEIPYGTITRSTRHQEEPFGKWVATEKLCIATDSLYGYDTDDSSLRLTALRGAIFADHYGERDEDCRFMDQGQQRLTYWVFPRKTNADAHRSAAELNCPARCLAFGFHKGALPERSSLFEQSVDGCIVTAIKESEDRSGTVIRMLETEGDAPTVSLRLMDHALHCTLPHHGVVTLNDRGESLNFLEDRSEEATE